MTNVKRLINRDQEERVRKDREKREEERKKRMQNSKVVKVSEFDWEEFDVRKDIIKEKRSLKKKFGNPYKTVYQSERASPWGSDEKIAFYVYGAEDIDAAREILKNDEEFSAIFEEGAASSVGVHGVQMPKSYQEDLKEKEKKVLKKLKLVD